MENQIIICLEWIDKQGITKTINIKHDSADLADIVSNWSGVDITEDAFVEAIKLRGIPLKRTPFTDRSINVGLSEKTVRLYRDRILKDRYGVSHTVPALLRDDI